MRRPVPTTTSKPFYDAAAAGHFSYPRCPRCGTWHTYPRPWCTRCLHEPLDLVPVSGLGTVYAATVVHRPPAASFADLVPYTFALVHLDEGIRLTTMIIDCEPNDVHVGMRVEAQIDPPTAQDKGAALILFRPRSTATAEPAQRRGA